MKEPTRKRVDVILNIDRNGMLVPFMVERDGQFYKVRDVKQIRVVSGRQRIPREKYLVNINGHDKFVFREGIRWFVYDEDEDVRTFACPAASPAEALVI